MVGTSSHGKVLVSACLIGHPVRYNGTAKALAHPLIQRLQAERKIVAICPELSAGFAVPRLPAEIENGMTGDDVLEGRARVLEANRSDVTELYLAGARTMLALAQEHGCRFALLTDGSPSCGARVIYNGAFSGQTHPGTGVAAAFLRRNNMQVFAETEIDQMERHLNRLW